MATATMTAPAAPPKVHPAAVTLIATGWLGFLVAGGLYLNQSSRLSECEARLTAIDAAEKAAEDAAPPNPAGGKPRPMDENDGGNDKPQ